MANDVTLNPIVLDTVTATAHTTNYFEVLAIRWTSASTADTIVIQDQDGNKKWQGIGAGANHTEESHWSDQHPLRFNGLKVSTLDAGTVMIYTRQKPPV